MASCVVRRKLIQRSGWELSFSPWRLLGGGSGLGGQRGHLRALSVGISAQMAEEVKAETKKKKSPKRSVGKGEEAVSDEGVVVEGASSASSSAGEEKSGKREDEQSGGGKVDEHPGVGKVDEHPGVGKESEKEEIDFLSAPVFAREEEGGMKRKETIDRMIRVDHAGELGARQIYAGQLAVFRGTSVGEVIEEMAAQERKHLKAFNGLISSRRVRPTVMLPLWRVAGYGLGLGTALLGKEAAMACTVAVEEVIAEHYNDQIRELHGEGFENEEELRSTFKEFRDEELEHKDTGIEHDAEAAPLYRLMSRVIAVGCRAAIYVSTRA